MYYFTPDVLHAKTSGTTATKEDKQKYADLIGPMDAKLDRLIERSK